jgi:hypothetical protein
MIAREFVVFKPHTNTKGGQKSVHTKQRNAGNLCTIKYTKNTVYNVYRFTLPTIITWYAIFLVNFSLDLALAYTRDLLLYEYTRIRYALCIV